MARHWSQYAGGGLSDKQVRAADNIAAENELGDGLAAIAVANAISRSKATKQLDNKHHARQLMDTLFRVYGRGN